MIRLIVVESIREWLSRIASNHEQMKILLQDKDSKVKMLKKRLNTLKDTISSQVETVTQIPRPSRVF